MAYCPICKKEYGLTVTFCPECNVALQEDEEKVPMFSLAKEEAAQGFVKYAEEQGVPCAYEYSQREDTYKIFVSKKAQKKGPKLFAEFLVQENRKKKGDNALPAKEPPRKPVVKEEPAPEEVKNDAKEDDDELDAFLAKAPEPAPAPKKPVNFYIPPIRRKSEPVEEPVEPEKEAPVRKPAAKPAAKTESAPMNPAAALFDAPPKKAPTRDRYTTAPKPAAAPKKEAPAPAPVVEEKPAPKAVERPVEKPVEKPAPKPVVTKKEEAPKSAPAKPVAPVRKPEPAKKESLDPDNMAASAISLFESKPVGKRDIQVGPVLTKKPSEDGKHNDILNLFLNPAQPAPKRKDDGVGATGDKYSVAPGEDPIFDMPSDPFYGSRNTKPSYNPSAKEAIDDSSNAPIVTGDELYEDESLTAEETGTATYSEEAADDYDYTYSSEPDFEPEETDSYYTDDRSSDPIFVETERIKDEELDSDNIIEAANVISIDKEDEEPLYEDDNDDAFDTFLSNYRKDDDEDKNDDILDSFLNDVHNMDENLNNDSLEISEVLPDHDKYDSYEEYDFNPGSGRPKDIQDTAINVSADSNIIEEVFDTDVEVGRSDNAASSVANPDAAAENLTKAAPRKFQPKRNDNYSDIDDYAGFVPDYSFDEKEEVQETAEEAAYREFTEHVAERKREKNLAANQKKSEQTRKANLEFNLDKKGKKGKIVFEDTDDLDSYAGFIPDYKPNTDNEKDFEFYKPHTVSSYAKYKKGKKETSDSSLMNMTHMRATNAEEIRNVFIEKIPNGIKNSMDPSMVRSTGFIISMSGKQLAQLFNSWLLLNMTSGFVKQFEKAGDSMEDNTENKIVGMKNVLINTFGELNESFLDYVVRRYYAKYLED